MTSEVVPGIVAVNVPLPALSVWNGGSTVTGTRPSMSLVAGLE